MAGLSLPKRRGVTFGRCAERTPVALAALSVLLGALGILGLEWW
jgi:hypothetical protein